MKFKTTPYHYDLLKDEERLAIFYEAISSKKDIGSLAYDLGCGSGILSYFLQPYFNKIISIEKDKKSYRCAKENLSSFSNIEVINDEVLNYNFIEKADLIVCEMLDTALIDEEQVPILNYANSFLKENSMIIPEGVINYAELVSMEKNYIHYDEDFTKYEVLSNKVKYSEFDFYNKINEEFETKIDFELNSDAEISKINGLKITTYTIFNEEIIASPTPMLNPPLLIPINNNLIKKNNLITIKLKYIMGQGIESIKIW